MVTKANLETTRWTREPEERLLLYESLSGQRRWVQVSMSAPLTFWMNDKLIQVLSCMLKDAWQYSACSSNPQMSPHNEYQIFPEGQNCPWWRIPELEPILRAVSSVKLTGRLFCPLGQEANKAVDWGYRDSRTRDRQMYTCQVMESGQLRQRTKAQRCGWQEGGVMASQGDFQLMRHMLTGLV